MAEAHDENGEPIEVQIVPTGEAMSAIVRGEIDIQIATAKRFPRNIAKFRDNARSLAMTNKKIARSCRYSVPRAGKLISGASVRLAEICATTWGNCRVSGKVVGIEAKHVVAQGQFIDLETNYAVSVDVFRRITYSDGRRYNDDMILTTCMAAVSIARRNAIIAGIPRSYIDELADEIKSFTAGGSEDGKQRSLTEERNAAFQFLASKGIAEAAALKTLGRGSLDEVTFGDVEDLRGLFRSVKDGITTFKEAFANLDNYAPPASKETSAEEALKAAQAASEETPKPETPPEPAKADQGKPKKPETPAKPAESKKKNLTPKQKLVKSLLPILKDGQAEFIKACQQGLGGKPDMNLEPETLLENFTQKDLEAISEALKNPQAQPAEEEQATETPDKPSEPQLSDSEQQEPASEPPKAEEAPAAPAAPVESSEADPERAKLVKAIKEHDSALAHKIAIVSEVCGASFSDQALADMAENPELIENIEKLRSVNNILSLMS